MNDAYIFGETLPIVALIWGMFFILVITIGKVLVKIGKSFTAIFKLILSIVLLMIAFTCEKPGMDKNNSIMSPFWYRITTKIVFGASRVIMYDGFCDILAFFGHRENIFYENG